MNKQNVLITGANSPYGKYICSYLRNYDNYIVHGLVKKNKFLEGFHHIYEFDLQKKNKFIDEEFNYIFHLASAVPSKYSLDKDFFDINVNGSLSLFKSVKLAKKAIIINISSFSVYNDPTKLFIREDSQKESENAYGLSKLMFENELCKYLINRECMLFSFRVPVLLVPGIKGNFISSWASKISNNESITLYNPNSFLNAVISGRSIIDFILNLKYKNSKLSMNLASKNPLKIIEVARIMSNILNKELIYKEETNGKLNQQIVTSLAENNDFIIPDLKSIIEEYTYSFKTHA